MSLATDGELTFVVAGEPPNALAVAADRVHAIVSRSVFAGEPLDLRALVPAADDDSAHVLVVRREGGDVGLWVGGRLKLLTLNANAVLPLPEIVGRELGFSHVLAPRGAPLMFVLDLARFDGAEIPRCIGQAHAVPTEN